MTKNHFYSLRSIFRNISISQTVQGEGVQLDTRTIAAMKFWLRLILVRRKNCRTCEKVSRGSRITRLICYLSHWKKWTRFQPVDYVSRLRHQLRQFSLRESMLDKKGSTTSQRYIHHRANGSRVALFIRHAKKDDFGRTAPYLCAGLSDYVSHTGDRPMAITWKLHQALPAQAFLSYRAAVAWCFF